MSNKESKPTSNTNVKKTLRTVKETKVVVKLRDKTRPSRKKVASKVQLASTSIKGLSRRLIDIDYANQILNKEVPLSALTIPKLGSHPHSTGRIRRTISRRSIAKNPTWNHATIYQLYPRSFFEKRSSDKDHRGEGSILGIIHKIDYLKELGIDTIWLSPFYPSPMVDSGYDVSDYCNVDPRYGTLEDFDKLIQSATNAK